MSVEQTTIQIDSDTRERLFQAKDTSTETYDELINRLLEGNK